MTGRQITEADIPVVNAMADAIRAYLASEAPHVLALSFNADVEEMAARVLPIAQAAARERVAAYVEKMAALAPACLLLTVAGWCRDDTIWNGGDE